MPCTIAINDHFGPAVSSICHGGFDFTLLFEEVFLCIAPIVIASAIVPFRMWGLLNCPPRFQPGLFYYTKLCAHSLFIVLQLVNLIALCVPGFIPKTRASIAAASLSLYFAIVLIGVSYLEHLRSARPSPLLSLYFGGSLVFDIVRTRTLWTISHNSTFSILFTISVAIKLALFILESVEKEQGFVDVDQKISKETSGNVFTRLLFWWLNPLLKRGFKHVLETESLPVIDNELTSPERQRRFWIRWSALPNKTPMTLVKLLFVEYKSAFLAGVFPRLCYTGFTYAQPFLITRVVSFAVQPEQRLDSELGSGLIVATVLIYIGLAVSNATAQHRSYRVITMLRGTLVALIYQKTLSASIPTAQDSSAVTLMSTDVERSGTGLKYVHEIWASPIDIVIASYLLSRQLGPASAAPGILFMLCSVAGLKVAASMGQRQRLWLEAIEKRVKATSDMLSSMKEVRMGGLQSRTEKELRNLRKQEIFISRKFKHALALIVCISYTTTALGPVITFGIFSFLAKKNNTTPLDTEKAFTSLALLALLRTPMALIIDSIAGVVASVGAMQRIGAYLSIPTHLAPPTILQVPANRAYDPDLKRKSFGEQGGYALHEIPSRTSISASSPDTQVVVAKQVNAGWDEAKPYVVKELDFTITHGSLTFIVGPVGCGKSTLLHAILGETTKNNGVLDLNFARAAFCSQAPWLVNDTIKKNIFGVNPYNEDWYNTVINACALRDDIDRAPHGDLEAVGSNGVNLSGGQQARVAVARAVYSKQRVLIFDDVMSGLDARTENTMFNNLFGPKGLLRNQGITVIFATNAIHRISVGDHIIVLGADGKILEQGSFLELETVGKHGQSSDMENDAPETASNDAQMQGLLRSLTTKDVHGSSRRTGDLRVYKHYIRIVGPLNFAVFVLFGAVFVFSLIFPQYIVKWWTDDNREHPNRKLGVYLGAYLALSIAAIIALGSGCWHLVTNMMPRASSGFHSSLLTTTLNAPLSLFTSTDVGETVNRFSQDLQLIDMELPLALFNTIIELLSSIAQFIVIAVSAKFIGAAMPAVLLVFYLVQKFYLRTARQLRLLDIEAKGPLFSGFLETLAGLATIRAFNWEAEYEARALDELDYSQRPSYLLFCVQRWLNLVLDFIVAGVAIIVITIAVKTKGDLDPSLIGIALVNIVNFSVSIKALLENWTNLETSIGAVSRVRSFAQDIKSEHRYQENQPTPPIWPSLGSIKYEGVTATWAGKQKPAIMALDLVIEPGQKLAICGRSGSGKSSLVSALFRLLEPQEGRILIDDIDISTLQRQDVRSRLICVTQTPFLLSASIRANIDPFGHADDTDIVQALRDVQMWGIISELGGLDAVIDSDKMSIGQKQLLCLARATLRPGSILILDEATASLDYGTDELVQKVIRSSFRNHTIVTVAHRLQTIIDYDRVVVISDGRLAEYGKPSELVKDDETLFAKLYKVSAGAANEEKQRKKSIRKLSRKYASTRSGRSLSSLPEDDGSVYSPLSAGAFSFNGDQELDVIGDYEGYYDSEDQDEQPLMGATITDFSQQIDFFSPTMSTRSRSVRDRVDDAFTMWSNYQRTLSVAGRYDRLDTMRRQQTRRHPDTASSARYPSMRKM